MGIFCGILNASRCGCGLSGMHSVGYYSLLGLGFATEGWTGRLRYGRSCLDRARCSEHSTLAVYSSQYWYIVRSVPMTSIRTWYGILVSYAYM